MRAGVHHFYIGLLFILLGFLLVFSYKVWSLILVISGLILCIDDYYQHFNGQDYTSPIHKLFAKYLWKYKLVRDITEFFDKLFGKE